MFDGAAGALTADDEIIVNAGSAIANTASTVAKTIWTTTPGDDVTLTPTDITTPSTKAFVVDSAGGRVLSGSILEITEEGRLYLFTGISETLGFDLHPVGKIKLLGD